jgi:TolB-like protein
MNKWFFFFFSLFFSLTRIFPGQIVISINDFTVESDNPSHKYIGKGLSRLVAGELRKSDKIKILEREQLSKILEEMELSLSGMMDASQQVEIGKLLSANKIIFGEIIDLDTTLLLSLRMVDVQTGQVIWQEEITEKLINYDYIGAYFARSILTALDVDIQESIVKKIENKEDKKEEGIIKLSEGIDAYDKNDKEKAKNTLEEVKDIDPANEVAEYYLSKLSFNSSKFKVELLKSSLLQNPAYYSLLQKDKFYFVFVGAFPLSITGNEFEKFNSTLKTEERNRMPKAGYILPVTDFLAFGIEYFYASLNARVEDIITTEDDNDLWLSPYFQGGMLSLSIRFSENIAIGLGGTVYQHGHPAEDQSQESTNEEEPSYLDDRICGGGEVGLLIKKADSSFIYDTRVSYTTELYATPSDETDWRSEEFDWYQSPLIWENTFTFAFNKKNTYIVAKEINYYFPDNNSFTFDMIPAIENWFTDFLSIRAGADVKLFLFPETTDWAFGGILGATVKIRSFDIDLNCEYRERPQYLLPDERYEELLLSIGITINGLIFK